MMKALFLGEDAESSVLAIQPQWHILAAPSGTGL